MRQGEITSNREITLKYSKNIQNFNDPKIQGQDHKKSEKTRTGPYLTLAKWYLIHSDTEQAGVDMNKKSVPWKKTTRS